MKFFYFIAAGLLLLSACRKNNDQPAVTPLPPSAADISRGFYYPASNSGESRTYSLASDSISVIAKINEDKQLILSFDVPYSKGNDFIKFTIEPDDIKPGYTGYYEILPLELAGLRGDAQVNYRYKRELYSYVEFMPGNAEGYFQLTSYNEKLKLVSGKWLFKINSIHDPKVGSNWVETKIDVQGRFENVQIK